MKEKDAGQGDSGWARERCMMADGELSLDFRRCSNNIRGSISVICEMQRAKRCVARKIGQGCPCTIFVPK
jgi:hypothetical protein